MATVRHRLADQGPILFVLAGNALGSDAKRMVDLLNRAHLDFATFGENLTEPRSGCAGHSGGRISVHLDLQQLYPAGTEPCFPRWFPGTRFGSRATRWVCSGSLFRVRIPNGIRCTNPDSAAHRTIKMLGADSADLIVAITHQSTDADRNLLGREAKLDLIPGRTCSTGH